MLSKHDLRSCSTKYNTINALQLEKVVFQALSLRHNIHRCLRPLITRSQREGTLVDHLTEILSIPSEYVRFALGSGPQQAYVCYVSDPHVDWPKRSEVSVTFHAPQPRFLPLRGDVFGLEQDALSRESLEAYLRQLRAIWHGRLRLVGCRDRVDVSEISEIMGNDCRTMTFRARADAHPVLGTFVETRYLHFIDGVDPVVVDVRVLVRGGDASPLEGIGRFIDVDRLDLNHLFDGTDEVRRGASPELETMEAQGIPVGDLSASIVSGLRANLCDTLPDLIPIGHLVARSNILLWTCVHGNDADLPDLRDWCSEIMRLALNLPDNFFRHFFAASICARTALLISAPPSQPDLRQIESLASYSALLSRLQDVNQNELTTLVFWALGALQEVDDIDLRWSTAATIAQIEGPRLALTQAVEDALDQAHHFATRSSEDSIPALLGLHRAELAAGILQAAASRGRFDAAGNSLYHPLFGKPQQYAFHYQGMLYGLDETGINESLARTAEGNPPGILYLRPLSVLRTVYTAPPSPEPGQGKLRTLEAALTDALSPLGQATNAVGGLGDIRGMQRSDTAGEMALWQPVVESLITNSGAILMLPDISDGIAWEIDTLMAKDQLARVIFILLPRELDWSDGGNHRGFERAFQLENDDLEPAGAFYIGHPALGEKLPWESLWNGKLREQMAKILRRFQSGL